MDAATYRRFTAELTAWAERHSDVIGLVALGSMADVAHSPDEWSDHDFWVVATDDAAPAIRDDPSWLPDPGRIVMFFAETRHGRNVIYDDGHLIEQAVFGDGELEVTRANVYRVLVDKADIADRMRAIAARTADEAAGRDPGRHSAGSWLSSSSGCPAVGAASSSAEVGWCAPGQRRACCDSSGTIRPLR